MQRFIIILTALVAVMLMASTVLAQSGAADATATPPAEEEAAAPDDAAAASTATPAAEEESATAVTAPFITMNLAAGYIMDPFFVSIEGGGTLDASELGEGCSGFINEAPALSVDWEGEADFFELFYYSDHDPVMVVETPAGDYLCADDANELLLDPVLQINDPAQGVYNIWVGSFDEGQQFPGILVITGRPEVNIGTFDLASLVRRAALPEDQLEAEELRPSISADIAAANADVAVETLDAATGSLSAEISAEGEFPAFDIVLDEQVCNGYVPTTADLIFAADGAAENIRIFFEGEQDATLIVLGPDDQLWCNDDAAAGANLNPLIDIAAPAAGNYAVYVGRLGLDEPITGTLTVTTAADAAPAELASPAGGSN